MIKPSLRSVLVVVAVVLVTLKFRNQLLGLVGKIPVVGGLVA